MTPYSGVLYFGITLYVVLPMAVLGVMGRATGRWTMVATGVMTLLQFGVLPWADIHQSPTTWYMPLAAIIAFAIYQLLVVRAFLGFRVKGKRTPSLVAALVLTLTPLLLAKYLPGFRPSSAWHILGLSYLTFRALDTVIMVHDGLITDLPSARYLTFLLFFPTISAGPIDRFRRFVRDLDRQRSRDEFLADVDTAVPRFFRGMLYKFVIAALVQQYWLERIPASHGALPTLSYMYAYSAYLFFDFAGYSAFAVAYSHLFGIHTPENFDRPFLATDIADFWNRWHISLSTWFRDHVYMRFVMLSTRHRLFNGRLATSVAGLALTFLLMGLWHGAAWRYVVYGAYHALLLSVHAVWRNRRAAPDGTRREVPRTVARFLTFNAVCFGFLIFSGRLG